MSFRVFKEIKYDIKTIDIATTQSVKAKFSKLIKTKWPKHIIAVNIRNKLAEQKFLKNQLGLNTISIKDKLFIVKNMDTQLQYINLLNILFLF